MGAFDAELYTLGYRFYATEDVHRDMDPSVKLRADAVAKMHLAIMPCPGSCGEVCANHHCSMHNGKTYNQLTSYFVRNKFTLADVARWKRNNENL
jgi:hypothetical protein